MRIRFLLLGLGVLLVLRLGYAGLELWFAPPVTTDLAVAIDGFRNGYLLGRPQRTGGRRSRTDGTHGLGRHVAAVLRNACRATRGIAWTAVRMNGGRSAIVVGRAVLLRDRAHGGCCGLGRPADHRASERRRIRPHRAQRLVPGPEHSLYRERKSACRAARALHPTTLRTAATGAAAHVEEVFTQYGSEQMVIARVVPTGTDCDAAGTQARERDLRS